MKETAVKTYTNRRQMEKGVKRMTDAGWLVSNVSEHREQKANMTFAILILALLTFGIALLFLLAARRTVYTVTFERGEYDKPERYRDIAASDYWKNHEEQDDVQTETNEVSPMNTKTKLFIGFMILLSIVSCITTITIWG